MSLYLAESIILLNNPGMSALLLYPDPHLVFPALRYSKVLTASVSKSPYFLQAALSCPLQESEDLQAPHHTPMPTGLHALRPL